MSRYPTSVRGTRLKCIDCNAPAVETVDDEFVCVECGRSPVERATETEGDVSASMPAESVSEGRRAGT